jgi:transketolase
MWSELDRKAIACARALAADAVQNAGHGHPGTAMALAPAAYLLFQKHLRHNPANAEWAGRDRFVLSIGHSSLTLYTQLLYSGYGLEMDDLRAFRQLGSLTPAHPEYGHTAGVETTTGPLGQGVGMAVGMAMAAKRIHATTGSELFDPTIWALAGDGCLQEGVTSEACSLAGHLGLGNLVVIYDDNHISIDGNTNLAFTEDVSARFRAYGWDVIEVPLGDEGDIDIVTLDAAMIEARDKRVRPTLIRMRSTIAWPAPKSRNTAKAHGSPIGAEDVAATKVLLGLDPDASFQLPEEVLAHTRRVRDRGAALEADWNAAVAQWRAADPESSAAYDALFATDVDVTSFPTFEPGSKLATRQASGKVLNAIATDMPSLFGGSADLGESNLTYLEGLGAYSVENRLGRNIHFGIREHAMGAIMNGLALFGFHAYGGTFLVFANYMLGAVRLSALMQVPTTYVWTHDSIGLGEDGPTHQPIETLWSLRAIPDFAVVRPADANETAAAWRHLIASGRPTGLVLSRQAIETVTTPEAAANITRGAYVLHDVHEPQAVVIATGSEVGLALEAANQLSIHGIATRVVSAPCLEWFDAQPAEYRESVLPAAITNRVSVEAGATQGWYKYAKTPIGVDSFGASGAPDLLYRQFGITVDAIVAAVKANHAH